MSFWILTLLQLYLAIVLIAIVLLTCTISYFQERSSGKLMDSIKNLLPQNCHAIRDGSERKLLAIVKFINLTF
jgi:sodium/potassium-transporting ATPase subunit alpha